MTLFSAAFAIARPSSLFRRTATILTASVLMSIAGVPGQPDRVRSGWAQPAPMGSPARPAGGHEPSQEEVDAAKQHFDSGVDFFQRGNYFAARAEFEAAYALSKYPQLLFNLGKTAEKLGQTADAIRYLESYLAATPDATDATEVRAKLADLRQQAGLPPVGTAPASEQAQPSKRPPTPALILLGAGAGLLIIGIGCGGAALADQSAIQSVVNTDKMSDPSFNSTYSQGKSLGAAAIAFDVLGGLSLAAGGAWTGYWLSQRHKAATKPAPAVSFIPVGLGAGIAGRF